MFMGVLLRFEWLFECPFPAWSVGVGRREATERETLRLMLCTDPASSSRLSSLRGVVKPLL